MSHSSFLKPLCYSEGIFQLLYQKRWGSLCPWPPVPGYLCFSTSLTANEDVSMGPYFSPSSVLTAMVKTEAFLVSKMCLGCGGPEGQQRRRDSLLQRSNWWHDGRRVWKVMAKCTVLTALHALKGV